ncbi:MAG: hypothetical protein AB7V46_01870 [Thermomicrobiales bacterium]
MVRTFVRSILVMMKDNVGHDCTWGVTVRGFDHPAVLAEGISTVYLLDWVVAMEEESGHFP